MLLLQELFTGQQLDKGDEGVMQIGRKIYFDISTGNVIVSIGELEGIQNESTVEQDIFAFPKLGERNRESFDFIKLSLGAYAQDFAEGRLIGVNLETKEPIFEYPDPEAPEVPIVPDKPFSESINENTEYLIDVDFRLSLIELGLN